MLAMKKQYLLHRLCLSVEARYIVTYNKKDFVKIKNFNIELLTPKKLLVLLGELP